MPKHITVVTPENVRIEYELAGLYSRAGAVIIDLLIQGLLLLGVAIVRYEMEKHGTWPGASWANAALGVGAFVVMYAYFVYFETIWNGQTPGKRYCRLRAVREGGLPIDLSCAALRNLVRVVDLPIGIFVMLFNSKNKRLGDFAAGTLVVKERGEWRDAIVREPGYQLASQHSDSVVKEIGLVTPEEFEAVSRFVERRAEFKEQVREELAAKLAKPLMSRLGIEDDGSSGYSDILTEIHRRCVRERGMR